MLRNFCFKKFTKINSQRDLIDVDEDRFAAIAKDELIMDTTRYRSRVGPTIGKKQFWHKKQENDCLGSQLTHFRLTVNYVGTRA